MQAAIGGPEGGCSAGLMVDERFSQCGSREQRSKNVSVVVHLWILNFHSIAAFAFGNRCPFRERGAQAGWMMMVSAPPGCQD